MPMRFPYHTDGRGCTAAATADDDDYIRDLIEQVLMTSPGERKNRPDFGCGLLAMAFAPGGDALQAALQATVQTALQRWLADLVQVQDVLVQMQEATVQVTVQYIVQRTQQQQIARFEAQQAGGSS
jgi:phage baseplate assembly protein W